MSLLLWVRLLVWWRLSLAAMVASMSAGGRPLAVEALWIVAERSWRPLVFCAHLVAGSYAEWIGWCALWNSRRTAGRAEFSSDCASKCERIIVVKTGIANQTPICEELTVFAICRMASPSVCPASGLALSVAARRTFCRVLVCWSWSSSLHQRLAGDCVRRVLLVDRRLCVHDVRHRCRECPARARGDCGCGAFGCWVADAAEPADARPIVGVWIVAAADTADPFRCRAGGWMISTQSLTESACS